MSIFKGLGWLFRSLWRLLNFTRLMLVNLLFLIVVLVIAFSLNQSETPSTPIEGALTLNLAGVLVEQRTQTDPTVQLLRQMEKSDDQPSEIVLSDLLWAIKSAGDDDRIKALVIKPQGLQGANFTKLQEVASAIDSFRESGKPVIAMADFYTQGQYLLAAHADELAALAQRSAMSIAPHTLMHLLLLQLLYSVPSEKQLYEQLNYNLLFRWFVGLELKSRVWSFNLFSHDLNALLASAPAMRLLQSIVNEVCAGGLAQMPEFSLNLAQLHSWLARHAGHAGADNQS